MSFLDGFLKTISDWMGPSEGMQLLGKLHSEFGGQSQASPQPATQQSVQPTQPTASPQSDYDRLTAIARQALHPVQQGQAATPPTAPATPPPSAAPQQAYSQTIAPQQNMRTALNSSMVQQAFHHYAPNENLPIEGASDALAKASSELPSTVDPYLPMVLSLIETHGGTKNMFQNNPYNVMGVNYPNYQTAILGGPNNGIQSKGLVGLINNDPAYADFRKSGDLHDFFKHYTPPDSPGNYPLDFQVNRYYQVRKMLTGQ